MGLITLHIEDLNIAWRKGLRRLLGLPYRTHSIMLSPLCGTLPLEYEQVCRSANFMNNCMNSCNAVVNFVTRNGIFFNGWLLLRDVMLKGVVILLVSRCTICVALTGFGIPALCLIGL